MFSRIKGLVGGSFGLLIMLVVLFFITYLIVHYTPAPISSVGKFAEKYAQPHS